LILGYLNDCSGRCPFQKQMDRSDVIDTGDAYKNTGDIGKIDVTAEGPTMTIRATV
jgi:hypothetical protein